MMAECVAFIGTGNMGGAILAAASRRTQTCHICIADPNAVRVAQLCEKYGCADARDNLTAARRADILLLCVKPQVMGAVLEEIAPVVRGRDVTVVSIAAGVTVASMREKLGAEAQIVRVMPNTPALIGEGVLLIADDGSAKRERIETLKTLLSGCGQVRMMQESMLDAASAVMSCSPAFVYMFIEALADGGVLAGLPRGEAQELAAMAVAGSAQMVLRSGMHPGALKDMVCSPGGTTMEAVRVLEEKGLRSAVIEASKACVKKARGL